jgi:hypothetical protein
MIPLLKIKERVGVVVVGVSGVLDAGRKKKY